MRCKKFLLMMAGLMLLLSPCVRAETGVYKVDIQNKEAAWNSGAAVDMTEPSSTWNIFVIATITGVPSPTFDTDPWIGLVETDGTGDPNDVIFTVYGDVTAGQFGPQNSSDLINARSDYIFVGSAGFVSPAVMSYNWSVTGLIPNQNYLLTFYSIQVAGRAGSFTANGSTVELDQNIVDTAVLLVSTDANGDIIGTIDADTGEYNLAALKIAPAYNPVITGPPENVMVFDGETALITVEAVDPTGGVLEYKWHKGGVELTDGEKYSGVLTDTLTIANADEIDEADYMCLISNVSGSVESSSVSLTIKELIGHWSFDGNLQDSIAGNDGQGADPNYVAGIVETSPGVAGQAIEIGVDGAVEISTAVHTNLSFTVAVWEYSPAESTNTGYIFGSGDPVGFETLYLRRWSDTDDSYVGSVANALGMDSDADNSDYTRDGDGDPTNGMDRGQWHHISVTYDEFTGNGALYVDGLLTSSGITNAFAGFDSLLFLGGRKTHPDGDTSRHYVGLFDDLKFFNYALSATEIAQEYSIVAGEYCAVRPDLDYNNDCEETIKDLAMLLTEWLSCGIYPDCITVIP